MCAIIDAANVGSELWDTSGTAAGQGFRRAIEDGRVPLVIGGRKLAKEIAGAGVSMSEWLG